MQGLLTICENDTVMFAWLCFYYLIRTNLQLNTSSSPFKGEVRRGMGLILHQILPHPHPSPPLEGEGDFI